MSDFESEDVLLSHTTNLNSQTKLEREDIFLKLLSNGNIFVDWSNLPKHKNVRQCVIHFKSLNNNQSSSIKVSRKTKNFVLRKIESGHLYEIHVCKVDRSNKIIESSEPARIQTTNIDSGPTLCVVKSTPDFVVIQWENPKDLKLSDIESYKLIINNLTEVILPSTENQFTINDGQHGKRYVYRIEINKKNGKVVSSIPISFRWPTITKPKVHALFNDNESLTICWGDSISINDGNIESYTIYLSDSNNKQLEPFGPYPPELRQITIQKLTRDIYYYYLEIKLTNSTKPIITKRMKIECQNQSNTPILAVNYIDSNEQTELVKFAYHLINIRDNIKLRRSFERCHEILKEVILTLKNLRDSIRLNLIIETKSEDQHIESYRLFIDGEEKNILMPGFGKSFSIELSRRDKPYELTVGVTPGLDYIRSNKVKVEASGHFSFFCNHFHDEQSLESCAYKDTLLLEKTNKLPLNQGLLKTPQKFNRIYLYDLRENKIISFPSTGKGRRLTIILFFIHNCIPSKVHYEYFSKYVSSHKNQYDYISINCTKNDIDDLRRLINDTNDLKCYTDFSSEDFQNESKRNEKPINEILSIEGVPTYFVLDFSYEIAWKGRLCVEKQSDFDTTMDHILNEINSPECSKENCRICRYRSMNDVAIESELRDVSIEVKKLRQQQEIETEQKKRDTEKTDRKSRIVSIRT